MIAECSKTEPEASPTGDGPLVYVVDDESMIVEIVGAILEMEGFQVVRFTNPVGALNQFATVRRKPDLLVTDYVMTPMNGMELIHKCRSVVPDLRAILYSGNVRADITDIYVTKPDAFLEKPFLPGTLVTLVQSVLEKKG